MKKKEISAEVYKEIIKGKTLLQLYVELKQKYA
jgi:hypothetical protein